MKRSVPLTLLSLIVCLPLFAAACAQRYDLSYHQRINEPIETVIVPKKDLSVALSEETLALSITDNESGYVWRSDDLPDVTDLNDKYISLAKNGISVGYFNARNIGLEKGFSDFDSEAAFTYSSGGIVVHIRLNDIGLRFTMNILYTDDGVSIGIPHSSITETNEAFRLRYIILYPFFGSSFGQTDGYMFIPDGSGAIIDLSVKTRAQAPYAKRVYGEDFAVHAQSGTQITRLLQDIAMPVFGAGYEGQNAFLAYIKAGAEYAELNMSPASVTTNYNYCYAKYIYRDSYFKLLNKQGAGYTALQTDRNAFSIEQKIMLLSGDNSSYSGMAERYRAELINDGELRANIPQREHTPIKIDFLMADSQRSLFGRSTVAMSTAGFVKEALADLSKGKTVASTIKGYGKGGELDISGFSYERKTGSGRQYKKVFEFCYENGIDMYIEMNLVSAEKGKIKKKDLAKTLSDQIVVVSDTRLLYWYLDEYYEMNLATPAATQKYFNNQLKRVSSDRVRGIEFQNVGNMLSSSFAKNGNARTDSAEIYSSVIGSGLNCAVSRPNQYLWKNINTATDMPLGSSGYLIFTKDVPFMQMLLSGSASMYGDYLNLNSNGADTLLRLIEFGVYPSYLLTEQNPIDLMSTRSNYVFCSQLSALQDTVNESYAFMDAALDEVKNARLITHGCIENGVYSSGYSNGKTIIVNYNEYPVICEGAAVAAKGFLVREG